LKPTTTADTANRLRLLTTDDAPAVVVVGGIVVVESTLNVLDMIVVESAGAAEVEEAVSTVI
jgi:hypothetical protein